MKRYAVKAEAVPLFAGVLALFASCEHKDLCFDHEEHALKSEVLIKAVYEKEWEHTCDNGPDWKNYEDWEEDFGMEYDSLLPVNPDGLRVQVYNEDGTNNVLNIAPGGGIVQMRPGEHSLLLYNNDTEYIVFDSLKASTSAVATTRSVTRSSLAELHSGERTMNQPDQLYGYYQEECIGEKTLEKVELPVTLRPLNYTYLRRYEFSKGLEYVALARGALAGMAEKVYLNDGHTDGSVATLLFDCELTDFGADVCMQSFGVPNYPGDHYTRADGSPAAYHLNLQVRLNNGQYKEFEFDVTDQVQGQPRGGVITVSGIEVTDEEGTAGGGGFDVDIEDWGDRQDIVIPLN